ncbi:MULTISPECIES: type I-E CRISPR-associated endonuclease Cas1e [unclassified Corynebacterium]|uniref:type I-E CRISPR-associated endonuclease Cas1e n=1 Tax=unclassified Corynebacterium TaxID=2624378 RepID=UPI0029C9DE9C|nr:MULTISPECIES: type I-E CRISPR-associated endonuclease Cas1e [unclassified Corynebacterium]WPF66259.1 type I-E CRISPR-associated endonuclease Cas1e [Corynebacterium sp. 22KM0430]WPF68749.1 type I-E CRISPR-associated endonuclease Cas1e [Corynebacterium sp. 21KM1197]
MTNPSELPLERQELARMEDRLSFLYVERAILNRADNALTITDKRGVAHVPATALAVVLLGPGTRVTHKAMALLGDAGCSTVWVGERGVRYYAHGRSPAKTARMAQVQARIVSNQRTRLNCARAMYGMRFPGEDVSAMSMAQLRGREGARMKKIYATEAARTGVAWSRRNYDPADFASGDPINRALTAANAALYGITHAVIVGLGFIPGLGVVHTGTDRSFVYDIADLYKAEITIPAAFDAVAAAVEDGVGLSADAPDLGTDVRRRVRDSVVRTRLMERIVKDLYALMGVTEKEDLLDVELKLWSELEVIAAGVNWGEEIGEYR